MRGGSKRKPAKSVFDADLPSRHSTEIDRALRINENAPRDWGQLRRIPDYPEECACIEQDVLCHVLLVIPAKRRLNFRRQLIEETFRQRLSAILRQPNRPGSGGSFGWQ